MKPLTEEREQLFTAFDGTIHSYTVSELTGEYQCENCGAQYNTNLKVCEVCGFEG